jgi:hypothetical protein
MLGVLSAVGYIVMHLGLISNYCSMIHVSKLQGSYIFKNLKTCHLVLTAHCHFFPRICLYNQNALNLSTSFFQML